MHDEQKPNEDTQELADLSALQILMGEPDDSAVAYTKTSAIQVSYNNLLVCWKLEADLMGGTDLVTRIRISIDHYPFHSESAKGHIRS